MKIETRIVYFGRDVILRCDGDCEHAWGKHWCGEKGEAAPVDPGTYEGGDAKPTDRRHNRWCARECERSAMDALIQIDGAGLEQRLHDFMFRLLEDIQIRVGKD